MSNDRKSLIANLRKSTGAPLKDCSKALMETNNVYDDAIKWLREKNIVKSAVKKQNNADESLCGIAYLGIGIHGCDCLVAKISFQTDFALNNAGVLVLNQLFLFALRSKVYNFDDLLKIKVLNLFDANDELLGVNKSVHEVLDVSSTCEDYLNNVIGVVGENVKISDFKLIQNIDSYYVHGKIVEKNNISIGKIVITVSFDGACSLRDLIFDLGKDIAMHAAFYKPVALRSDLVSQDELDAERKTRRKQNEELGKIPAQRMDMVTEAQVKKYSESISLEGQEFIKDKSKKVKDIVNEFNKKNNCNIKIKNCIIVNNESSTILLGDVS